MNVALAELTARFIACHAPHLRPVLRRELNERIESMVAFLVESMINKGDATEAWREPTRQ